MESNLNAYQIELESKIQILEFENETLSAKAEENLLLNRAFEEIKEEDEIDTLWHNTLESISILLNIPFSGIFDVVEKQFVCNCSFALFSNEDSADIQLKVSETTLEKLISKQTCFLHKTESGFVFHYPKTGFEAENAIIIPFDSEIINNRYFVFIVDKKGQSLAERLPLFEKIIRIISSKLERVYYQNELKKLNNELEKKVEIRTEELRKQNEKLITEWNRAEESEMKVRDILQTAMDGFWLVDRKGNFIEVNDSACETLGYFREEMLKMNISDIEVIESTGQIKERISKIHTIGMDRFESKHRCKNGQIIDVEVSARYNHVHNMIITVIKDITARKQRDEILRASEERFRKAIMDAPLPIMIHTEGGKVDSVNKQWEKTTGYTLKEIPTIDIWTEKAYFGNEREANKKRIEKLYGIDNKVDEGEYIITTKSGVKRNLFFSSTSLGRNCDGKNIIISMATDLTERIGVMNELKASEERFRLAVSMSPIPIMIHNEDNEVLQLSEGWTNYSGYTIVDIPTLGDWTEKAYGKRSGFAKKYIEDLFALKKTANTGEWEVTSKNGETRNWEFFTTPIGILSDGEKVLLSTAIDITDRKRAEKKTTDSEAQLRLLIEQSPFAIELYDLNGLQIAVNKAYEDLWGFPSSTTVGRFNVLKSIEVERTGLLAYVKRAYKGESVKVPDYQFDPTGATEAIGKGRHRWLSTNIYPLKDSEEKVKNIVIVHEDITKVKEYDRLIKESEEKYRTMIERSNDLIWMLDKMGNFNFFNKHVEETTGFLFKDWKGKSFVPLLMKNELPYINDVFRKTISGNTESYELHLKVSSGKILVLSVNTAPIYTGNEITGIVSFARDITQQKEAEEKLIKALEKATESDRLKSAFLANMSHEIRTPMNGILGFAELLKEPGLSGEEQQNYIQIIEKSGARMLNIINDIISISKIESGLVELSISEINVNEQIEQLFNFFKPEAEAKGIKLFVNNTLTAKQASLKTDTAKLYSILSNLIKNAIKYTSKGSIEIGCGITADTQDTLSLQFYVKDTGIGIAKERQEAIFERFIQADIEDKMARQGAGLGLAICKSYSEMLGGKIWVESTLNEGSVFYFTIPDKRFETAEKVIEIPIEIKESKKREFKTMTVLIVEDDASSYELLMIILERSGMKTLWAENGIDAVNLCKENVNIDLVLMDINIPLMNGYEATKQIKKFRPNLPIIAQTAFALLGDRKKALEAGCDDYLSKPVKREELMLKIELLLKDL
ncbi:MAG: hypothetical protein CVT92_12895 [Bacteroidetes bacterium HGW-Bacteroidetes-1]|jgi:hypothetical protein|nr:MAG: hypothetical protein CVT92_12895 [Bacteroidetes bacterium HGW-Bacteroidetes-1]